MTPEQIHDALNLLPSDLITEADKLRNPKKKFLVFRPWVATAACAVLVLLIGSFTAHNFLPSLEKSADAAPEAPAAAATIAPAEIQEECAMDTLTLTPTGEPEPMEEMPDEARGENAMNMDAAIDLDKIQYISTPVHPTISTAGDPRTDLITSREVLEQYGQRKSDVYNMEAFLANADRYNNAWFLSNDLLILRIGAPNPEFYYDVTGFTQQPDADPAAWQITLSRKPDEPTDIAFDNSSMWHILIPVPKGMLTEDATILIDFE